jgi:hypothetical protein
MPEDTLFRAYLLAAEPELALASANETSNRFWNIHLLILKGDSLRMLT